MNQAFQNHINQPLTDTIVLYYSEAKRKGEDKGRRGEGGGGEEENISGWMEKEEGGSEDIRASSFLAHEYVSGPPPVCVWGQLHASLHLSSEAGIHHKMITRPAYPMARFSPQFTRITLNTSWVPALCSCAFFRVYDRNWHRIGITWKDRSLNGQGKSHIQSRTHAIAMSYICWNSMLPLLTDCQSSQYGLPCKNNYW